MTLLEKAAFMYVLGACIAVSSSLVFTKTSFKRALVTQELKEYIQDILLQGAFYERWTVYVEILYFACHTLFIGFSLVTLTLMGVYWLFEHIILLVSLLLRAFVTAWIIMLVRFYLKERKKPTSEEATEPFVLPDWFFMDTFEWYIVIYVIPTVYYVLTIAKIFQPFWRVFF